MGKKKALDKIRTRDELPETAIALPIEPSRMNIKELIHPNNI